VTARSPGAHRALHVIATLVRIGLLVGIMYAYLITLGGFLHASKPGYVTQDVQLGQVYDNRSDDSPLALWSTDLEFIDVNGRYESVQGVVVGDVPIEHSCEVTDIPAPLRSTTTSSTFLPSATTSTTAPAAPPATDSTGRLTQTTKDCVDAIEITYDPANPKALEVVGAKDTEVLAFATLTLWAVFIISILVLLKALFGSYHPEGDGSLVATIVWAILGFACLIPGPFIVKEQPSLATLLLWPAIVCFVIASTQSRKWWHQKQLAAGNVPQPHPPDVPQPSVPNVPQPHAPHVHQPHAPDVAHPAAPYTPPPAPAPYPQAPTSYPAAPPAPPPGTESF
jgi:hypothetical protein